MRQFEYIFLVALLVGLGSCKKQTLLPSDLIQWVENSDNGLKRTQNYSDFKFEVLYKPVEYVIAVENRQNSILKSDYQLLKSELDGLQYLELRIQSTAKQGNAISSNLESQDEYYERLDYFVTHAQYDMQLVQGGDTLYPTLYHFERNYGLASFNKVLLAYKIPEHSGDRQFIINDRLLGAGRVKFEFNENDINSVPKLKLR